MIYIDIVCVENWLAVNYITSQWERRAIPREEWPGLEFISKFIKVKIRRWVSADKSIPPYWQGSKFYYVAQCIFYDVRKRGGGGEWQKRFLFFYFLFFNYHQNDFCPLKFRA